MASTSKQMQRVREYIKDFGSITRVEAMMDLGIANLTAVISRMRNAGYPVRTIIVKAKNRYGEPVHYARYTLEWEEI